MSGHSKWSQIKHKKAASDAKRGVLFGKFSRAISIAARDNPDTETNQRLQDIIQRARAANMPNDNIERAVRKGSHKDAAILSEIRIELHGPGDVAILVHAITDNRNRTIMEIRKLASSYGGRIVAQGAVSWMFDRMIFFCVRIAADVEAQQLAAIDAGAEDVRQERGALFLLVSPEASEGVRVAMGEAVMESDVCWVARSRQAVPEEAVGAFQSLVEVLEEHADVQEVATSAL